MTAQQRKPRTQGEPNRAERTTDEASVRIIGGTFRGRKLLYSGDTRTRPMKDRVREALFNLIGPDVKGLHAIDLFAGTGALGLESVSRGAAGATLIERHYPTAALIRRNVETLGAADRCEVVAADAFLWLRRTSPPTAPPWLVLCSPPFELYESQREAMDALIAEYLEKMPSGSMMMVEVPNTFDLATLPQPESWLTRTYSPVHLALFRKK